MSTLTMNGTSMNSPQSLSADESEESFVVLSPSLAPDTMENLMSVNSSMVNSAAFISPVDELLTNEICQAISAMSASATSELSPDEIHSKLESLLHENIQLKETLHQNNLAMKKQFSTLVAWQEDVMKVHQSHKEKFEETKKLITNLRTENLELKKTLSLPITSTELDTENFNLKSKISALEFELDTLRQGYMKNQAENNAKVTDLEAKITHCEKEKDELSTGLNLQINNLKSDLTSTQEKLNIAQKKMFEMAGNIPTESAKQTIEKLTKEVQDLTAEIDYKNTVLKDKADVLDKLVVEIKKIELENETIPILKTQVEVYQTDFNQEREARLAIAQEKERINEDLRHLQRRNQDLLAEVERLRDGNFIHVSTSQASAPMAADLACGGIQHPLSPHLLSAFTCPLCSNRFTSMALLQAHVNQCIK